MSRSAFLEVFTDATGGNPKLQTSGYLPQGAFPVIDQGKAEIAGYSDDASLLARVEPPVIIFGDHTRVIKYVDHPFILGADGTKVLRPINGSDPRYLFHYLRSLEIPSAGYSRHYKFLKEVSIPVPLLNEQRRIAAILDKADEVRTKRRHALAHLDVLAHSIFHSMFGDPISNPMGWPIVRVGDALESAKYGSSEKAALVGTTPVLRMNNLTYGGQIDLSQMKYLPGDVDERFLVKPGDVLFNRTNSAELVGKTAVFMGPEPMAYAGYLVRLRTSASCRPHFLGTFMNLPSTKKTLRNMCKSIVGMANINAKEVQTIKMPLPPVEKQNDFEARLMVISQLKDRHRAQLGELDALFASLQHRAFRGELS
ncbi:restriction endonuclease subunit S [Arthrobacter humicola]|uniref:restriction endonuclease subunit S n=1 Tax=Arthrobacter humicola TaxID=409291 RepID=UPI001FAD2FE7|nr:restriction endonuclease subunit S [Arthrobacter humicola]MCI9869134.1 restriction endonuclease subunit S [Arthrobacter humicola]